MMLFWARDTHVQHPPARLGGRVIVEYVWCLVSTTCEVCTTRRVSMTYLVHVQCRRKSYIASLLCDRQPRCFKFARRSVRTVKLSAPRTFALRDRRVIRVALRLRHVVALSAPRSRPPQTIRRWAYVGVSPMQAVLQTTANPHPTLPDAVRFHQY